MKNIKVSIVFLTLIIGLANCENLDKVKAPLENYELNSQTTLVFPSYQSFPDGYGFCKDKEQLQKAIDQQDRSYIRDHGWKLFVGMMQPAKDLDWPIWYTWPTVTQVFQQSGMEKDLVVDASQSLISTNKAKQPLKNNLLTSRGHGPILDDVPTPIYPIPDPVLHKFPNAVTITDSFEYQGMSYKLGNIKMGQHFRSDGDIMTATESFSQEGARWTRNEKLYLKKTLKADSTAYAQGSGPHNLSGVPNKWISTKHMYWPVLKDELGVLPIWNEDFGLDFRGYAGYENWKELVAIDASNIRGGQKETVSYLHNVFSNDKILLPTKTQEAMIYNINNFYHHQITEEDMLSWSDGDKASLMAASYWAYDKPIDVGDYVITIATHINTKEVPTWALQSAWWSNTPNTGKHSLNKPNLPIAKGPWKNYKLTTAYGLPDASNQLEASFNPYIELVIHPVATNCNNCHARAGFPHGNNLSTKVASYQNKGCENLLSYIKPDAPCLADHFLTDFIWVIPDTASE